MMNQDHKRPVTVEDLLRLKRAERPPAEFWNQFDRELRAKQLAAIVEKRPWWRTVPSVFSNLSRYHLPLGATAILALTVLTVREYRTVSPQGVPQPVSNEATIVLSSVHSESGLVKTAAGAPDRSGSEAIADNDAKESSAVLTVASEVTAPSELSRIIAEQDAAPQATQATPSARFIAANLALAQAAEPALVRNMLGGAHGFEARAIPARTPVVDPLSQMASPSDTRRRLLNGAVMTVSMNTSAARNTEFRSRRISDEQLYDTVSRFDAHGNRLDVKF